MNLHTVIDHFDSLRILTWLVEPRVLQGIAAMGVGSLCLCAFLQQVFNAVDPTSRRCFQQRCLIEDQVAESEIDACIKRHLDDLKLSQNTGNMDGCVTSLVVRRPSAEQISVTLDVVLETC